MSDSSPFHPSPSKDEIDISNADFPSDLTDRAIARIDWLLDTTIFGFIWYLFWSFFWPILCLTFILVTYLAVIGEWALVALLVVPICALAVVSAWLDRVYNIFNYGHLAELPAKELRLGNLQPAERAFRKAIERARRFPARHLNRGIMLSHLVLYLSDLGRMQEARALHQECVDILALHARKEPFTYFTVLNNYACFLTNLRDYSTAQKILEKVVDSMPATKKSDHTDHAAPYYPREELELVFHENLAYLFILVNELIEADHYLREAEWLLNSVQAERQMYYHDYVIALRAMWECASGNHAKAWNACDRAPQLDHPMCLQVRAKLHLVKQEYRQAERLLRKFLWLDQKPEMLHHPANIDPALDLAESFFGQGDPQRALDYLARARVLVADFDVPRDAAWRKSLQPWLDRAKTLGWRELAESLEEEIRQIPLTSESSFTVLERFRVPPHAPP